MSFRRDSSQNRAWKKWVSDHRDDLLDSGIPDWLLADELKWLRFLEEGYDYESGWCPRMLDFDKAETLHSFIQREYGDEQYRALLHDIEMYLRESRNM